MLDFTTIRDNSSTLDALSQGLTVEDLRNLTREMIGRQLALLEGCLDEDVVFVPEDPDADDQYAEDKSEADLAWTLGHVIVHATASSEESAFKAAEMARGVKRSGRSRYETPWQEVTTIAYCRQRLEESRRMRRAMLDVWPDPIHLEVTTEFSWLPGTVNAKAMFLFGLMHDDGHLAQIEEIVRQAQAARQGLPART